MKKTASLLLMLACAAVWAVPAWSAGEAVKCVVTIKKVELKNAAGDWKTAFEGDLPLDLAASESAATFVNKLAPEGTYVGVRLLLDETFEVAGSDGPAMTRDGGVVEIRGTAGTLAALPGDIQSLDEKKPSYSQREAGPIRVTLDYDYADRDKTIELFATRDFNKPFAVKLSSKIAISLRANLTESIVHVWPGYFGAFPDNDAMIFAFPKNFTEFSVKVDGASLYAGGTIDVKF
jgi:hypothetical protein